MFFTEIKSEKSFKGPVTSVTYGGRARISDKSRECFLTFYWSSFKVMTSRT